MRRRKKIFIIVRIITVVFLCGVIASVVALSKLNVNYVRDSVVNALAKATGANVEITGDFDLHMSLRPKISLYDLRIENASWAKHKYAFEAKTVTVNLNLLFVFNKQLMIEKLEISNPVVYIEQNAKGEMSLPALNKKTDTVSGDKDKSLDKYLVRDLGLGAIEFHDIDAHIVDTKFKLKGIAFQYEEKKSGPEYSGWVKVKSNVTPFVISFGEYNVEQDVYPINFALSTNGNALIGKIGLHSNTMSVVDFNIKGDVPDNELLEFIFGWKNLDIPRISLNVSGTINDNKITFNSSVIKTKGNDIVFSGTGRFGKIPTIDLNVKSSRLNLLEVYPGLYGNSEPVVGRELNVFHDMNLFGKEIKQMNIKLKTDIKHLIVYRDIDIQNVNVSINVTSGKGRVDANVGFANGDIKIGSDVDIDNDGRFYLKTGMLGRDIDLGELMRELKYENMISSLPMDIIAYFEADGTNMSEIMQTITGPVQAYSTQQGYAYETLVAYMYGADFLTTLQRGVSDALSKEKKYNKMTIENVGINLKLRNGLIETENGVGVQTDIINIRMVGSLDLGNENIDLTLVTTPVSGLKISITGTLTNALKISGNLAEPDISISGSALVGRVATATGVGLLMAPFTGGLSILGGWLASDMLGNWLSDDKPAETAMERGAPVKDLDPDWLDEPIQDLIQNVIM